jgi:abequosyltransferase
MDKENENILLSICIPTYNRANYLRVTLDSIVKQDRFNNNNDIEIVISDNCSDDNTVDVSNEFIEIYGSKIRYFTNPSNIKDKNFEKVLSEGRGVFLKLNNDTLKHNEGSLDQIVELINENILSKNILFFSNGILKKEDIFYCENLDSFVKNVSYYSTWIGAFGIWKTDFERIKYFSRYSKLQLVQTDVLFRLFYQNKSAVINNKQIFFSMPPIIKGGYDLITVFLDNYLYLLKQQIEKGLLTKKVYNNEKKSLLLNHICPWLINTRLYPEKYSFTHHNFFIKMFIHYGKNIFIIFCFILKYNAMLIRHYLKNGE